MTGRILKACIGAAGLIALALGTAAARPAPPPPSPNDFAPLITDPTWAQLPSADRIGQYFPEAAMEKHRGGGAVVACRVRSSGRLENCTVILESPEGFDFGKAARRMAIREFRMNPATVAGKAFDGGLVVVPINFYQWGMSETPRIDYQAGDASVLLTPDAAGTIPCPSSTEAGRKCKAHFFDWVERPRMFDVDTALVKAGDLNGVSQINCRADADGRLTDCRLLGESGSAAQAAVAALVPLFKVSAKAHDGTLMGDNRIVVTLNWPHIRTVLENIRQVARAALK